MLILNILKKYSDGDHRLSAKDIGDLPEKEYSQKVDTGEGIQVSFRAKHSLISDILDWFGTDTILIREDDEHIIATVSVN
jgi:hypothetical protein